MLRPIVHVICLATATGGMAQSARDIAYFHVNRVKSDMTAQYEAARRHHWVWHQKMGDTWSFHVWQIVSGEGSGTYMVCSFGHTWKEVDESDQKVGGEEYDPSARVEPYLTAEWESYYRYLPQLSVAPEGDFSPTTKLAVTRFLVKSEAVGPFVAAAEKIKKAMTARGYRGAIRWYELVSGGETPQFLMLDNRADWASYEQTEKETLDSVTERTFGRQQGAEIMKDFRSAIRSEYVETWQYRADLSFVPAKK